MVQGQQAPQAQPAATTAPPVLPPPPPALGCPTPLLSLEGLQGRPCTDDQSRATKQEQANLCAVTVLCAST